MQPEHDASEDGNPPTIEPFDYQNPSAGLDTLGDWTRSSEEELQEHIEVDVAAAGASAAAVQKSNNHNNNTDAELRMQQHENPPQPPSSVHGEVDDDDTTTASYSNTELLPHKPELSLKEKLVVRERQRRIETERARLKRQFALSGTEEEEQQLEDDEGDDDGSALRHHHLDTHNDANIRASSMDEEGTLGEESMRAHPDEETVKEEAPRLGFNMERFLRNSESTFQHPVAETMIENGGTAETEMGGVVMERFLNDPFVVSSDVAGENENSTALPSNEAHGSEGAVQDSIPPSDSGLRREAALEDDHDRLDDDAREREPTEPHRTVSFDMDGVIAMSSVDQTAAVSDRHGYDRYEANLSFVSNVSVQAESSVAGIDIDAVVDEDATSSVGEPATSAASLDVQPDNASSVHEVMSSHNSADGDDDQPRVLRLTEADMQEMASIEEASIGNAPPSERNEEEILSEIGELLDFGPGPHIRGADTAASQGTPTTAMESSSQISGGNRSHHSANMAPISAFSSTSADHHDDLDDGGILRVRDPSDFLRSPGAVSMTANPPSEGRPDVDMEGEGSPINDVAGTRTGQMTPMQDSHSRDEMVRPFIGEINGEPLDEHTPRLALVNRPRRNPPVDPDSPDLPEPSGGPAAPLVVDGFDFDKDAPSSPLAANSDSFRGLPEDSWSPLGKMNISLLHAGSRRLVGSDGEAPIPEPPNINYGSIETDNDLRLRPDLRGREETAPLLRVGDDIPPEMITRRNISEANNGDDIVNEFTASSLLERAFSEIRSKAPDAVKQESFTYSSSSAMKRGKCWKI
jgi:hypothetical protein